MIYSPDQRRSGRRRLRTYFFWGSALLVAFFLVYWLFFSAFWQIQFFEISGLKDLEEDEMVAILRSRVKTENFWLWPSGQLNFPDQPLLAEARITKDFFKRSLAVIVQERRPAGVWCNAGYSDCYWFDNRGIAFKSAPRPEGSFIVTLDDPGREKIGGGDLVMRGDDWINLRKIITSWLVSEKQIRHFVINRPQQEVVAKAGALEILLTWRFDPAVSLAALKQLVAKNEFNLEKVNRLDLRVENRIYFR